MCLKPNFLKTLKTNARKQETNFHLNYYTLRINNTAIVQQLNLRFFENFDLMFWSTLPLQALVLIAMTAIYFAGYAGGGVFLYPIMYLLMVCLWQALRYTRFKS